MKERLFRFKKFSVKHQRSAMKVGVDGVLIGAWASCGGCKALDVGTGCGLIALMLAQRNEALHIDAIDVDSPSVEEAVDNVSLSPWSERVKVSLKSFGEFVEECGEEKYDIIVSNPPYYDAGISDPSTPRERARHQGDLSPHILLANASKLLTRNGRLSMIVPTDIMSSLIEESRVCHLTLIRLCYVRNHVGLPEKRVMLEFEKQESANETESSLFPMLQEVKEEHLTMLADDGTPTNDYRGLCGEFYLYF